MIKSLHQKNCEVRISGILSLHHNFYVRLFRGIFPITKVSVHCTVYNVQRRYFCRKLEVVDKNPRNVFRSVRGTLYYSMLLVFLKVSCTVCVQFLWNSFYRKRLSQQNGDMKKRDLHAFKLHLEQGRLLSPLPRPPPPAPVSNCRDKRGWLACVSCPPPSPHGWIM